jgi:imidazole glycerol-phosphate synthase subunit HisF
MRRIRVIPTLLLNSAGGLVKTVRFRKRTYLGDPINAVKIFNEKEVDELILLDIDATREHRAPRFDLIQDIVSEAFMPVGYGGGVRTVEDMARLFRGGVEKIVVSSAAVTKPGLVREGADRFGSQSIVVCLDVLKDWLGTYRVSTCSGTERHRGSVEDWAKKACEGGAGELIVYAVHRDGTYAGYDLELSRRVAQAVPVPVVACGGAAQYSDFAAAVGVGCAAIAAGSIFVYQGRERGVLITYPKSASALVSP